MSKRAVVRVDDPLILVSHADEEVRLQDGLLVRGEVVARHRMDALHALAARELPGGLREQAGQGLVVGDRPVSAPVADEGYSSFPGCRELPRERGSSHAIPERRDRWERRAGRRGREPGFDAATHARRNAVERCANKPKRWRGSRRVIREASGETGRRWSSPL